ncbi:MAG: hypothetical protein ACWA6R_07420 [Nitrosomonas sp.]
MQLCNWKGCLDGLSGIPEFENLLKEAAGGLFQSVVMSYYSEWLESSSAWEMPINSVNGIKRKATERSDSLVQRKSQRFLVDWQS